MDKRRGKFALWSLIALTVSSIVFFAVGGFKAFKAPEATKTVDKENCSVSVSYSSPKMRRIFDYKNQESRNYAPKFNGSSSLSYQGTLKFSKYSAQELKIKEEYAKLLPATCFKL